MPFCEYCGNETGLLPFKCSYCDKIFCGSHRLPENHECSFEKKYQSKELIKKESVEIAREKERDIGNILARLKSMTLVLFLVIISFSLLGIFYPRYLNFDFFSINPWSLFTPNIWTLIPGIFVVSITNILEFCFFIVLIIFAYNILRNFEKKYGSKLLLIAYLASVGLILFCNFILGYAIYDYWRVASYNSGIGLASGSILGLMTVLLIDNVRRDWSFKKIKIKLWKIFVFLIIMSIVTRVYTTLVVMPSYVLDDFNDVFVVYYLIDFYGILGGLAFSGGYYKYTSTR